MLSSGNHSSLAADSSQKLSRGQQILRQRLLSAQEKLGLKPETVNVLPTQNEIDQQSPLSSSVSISDKDDLETSDPIIERSLSLQKIEHQLLGEKIYVTSEMNSIRYILQYPGIDLAVFDVDDTLIMCLDPFFDVHILSKTPLSQSMLGINEIKRDRFYMGLLATRPWVIIEPQSPELMTEFQSNGIKVIALTALWPAIDESLDLHIPNWRVNHLKAFGYDFSKSFPIPMPCLYGFAGSDSQNPSEPYFKNGVMFSGEVPKGKALLSFLRTVSHKPKGVLFVDDNVNNVRSVYRELSRMGIECNSILYTRTQKFPLNSMFSKEEYDRCLKKQEESVKEFLRLEGIIHEITTQEISEKTNVLPIIFSSKSSNQTNSTSDVYKNYLGLKKGFLLK